MSLTNQNVVIVGGTSGIGLAVDRRDSGQGARVAIASGRQASVDRALTLLGEHAIGRTVDVLDTASLEHFFAEVGTIDQLV